MSGHTNGHIAFHLASTGMALSATASSRWLRADVRRKPRQFWESLKRIKALPASTTLYCAHEYTAANAKFALHADPDNEALQSYAEEIAAKRDRGEPTVPTRLGRELDTNPFLRADDPALMEKWGGSAPHETFAALRSAKDSF